MLLISPQNMQQACLSDGQMVSLVSDGEDDVHRKVGPLKVTPFTLPDGCAALARLPQRLSRYLSPITQGKE